MQEEEVGSAYDRRDSLRFFTTVFMELPHEDFVEKLRKLRIKEDDDELAYRAIQALRSYGSTGDVIRALSLDRTQLLRGLDRQGPRPPYESLYREIPQQKLYGHLNQYFVEANVFIDRNTHVTPDYLGTEFSFLENMVEKEIHSAELSDIRKARRYRDIQSRFTNDHLSTWVPRVGEEFIEFAHTEFFRTVGHMLKRFPVDVEHIGGEDTSSPLPSDGSMHNLCQRRG